MYRVPEFAGSLGPVMPGSFGSLALWTKGLTLNNSSILETVKPCGFVFLLVLLADES